MAKFNMEKAVRNEVVRQSRISTSKVRVISASPRVTEAFRQIGKKVNGTAQRPSNSESVQ